MIIRQLCASPIRSKSNPQTFSDQFALKNPAFQQTKKMSRIWKNSYWNKFANSAFKTDGQFPAMSGKPTHICRKQSLKLNTDVLPVPYHLKEPVRQALMQDIRGILKQVPIGTPMDWCSTMVITTKKDGRPRLYHRLSISEFTMQARNPPHCLIFPAGNAGATQYQKDSAGCCGWLSLLY